ncbi:MAG: hypothetical protein ACI4XM_03510 [Candidatus Coprovivens sp.]
MIQPQANHRNKDESTNISSTYSQVNENISNNKKKSFDQRSQSEIRIAEQTQLKNQAIAQTQATTKTGGKTKNTSKNKFKFFFVK